jgi:DNA-binding MarR family transcriptional regulator
MRARSQAQQVIRDRFQHLVPQMILLHERVAKDVGIPAVALQALHLIDLHDGPISPSELSVRSGLPRSTVARILANLEADGYVRRAGVPHDGRRALIDTTAKARTVGERFDLYADAFRATDRGFSDAELAVVARYWDALLDNVIRPTGHTAEPGKESS